MEFENVTKVLYHKNCHDGLSCAGIFYKIKPEIEYLGYSHGSDLLDYKNEIILILDLSLPEELLNKLMKNNIIYIVDHHLSSEKIISKIKLPNMIYYDKIYCGALNLWKLLYPEENIPKILLYVNDRDLWLNKMENYLEIFNGLTLEENNICHWSNLIYNLTDEKFNNIKNNGKILVENMNKHLELISRNMYFSKYIFENKSYDIIYCNSPIYQSDLGNYILEQFPDVIVGIYYYNGINEKTIFSLRGKNIVNLSKIAELYGGGGHYNAAGLSINKNVNKLV